MQILVFGFAPIQLFSMGVRPLRKTMPMANALANPSHRSTTPSPTITPALNPIPRPLTSGYRWQNPSQIESAYRLA